MEQKTTRPNKLGRKSGSGKYGEPTLPIRIPYHRLQEVRDYIDRTCAVFTATDKLDILKKTTQLNWRVRKMSLNRNAQLVALIHFPFGLGSEVAFSVARYTLLPENHKIGLADLAEEGMVEMRHTKHGKRYSALRAIGIPYLKFEKMKPEESWAF
jgi:hypothetical protein